MKELVAIVTRQLRNYSEMTYLLASLDTYLSQARTAQNVRGVRIGYHRTLH